MTTTRGRRIAVSDFSQENLHEEVRQQTARRWRHCRRRHDRPAGARRQGAGCDQAARPARVRRQYRSGRLFCGRQPGQLERSGRRRLPCHCRGHSGRCDQGALGAAERAAAVHGAGLGRDRRAVAQLHLDADARCLARSVVRGHHLLRRPGLHGAGQGQDPQCQAVEGCHGLRAVGHHHREEPDRLLARQQPRHQAGGVREGRGRHRRLLRRPLPGLHDRRLGPGLGAQPRGQEPGRPHHPAGAHLQGAAGSVRAAR